MQECFAELVTKPIYVNVDCDKCCDGFEIDIEKLYEDANECWYTYIRDHIVTCPCCGDKINIKKVVE